MVVSTDEADDLHGFRPTYGVELLYVNRPDVTKSVFLSALRRHCPSATALDGDPGGGLLAFFHPDHLVGYSDGRVPTQIFIAATEQPPHGGQIEAALQQSWSFPEARRVVAACTTSLLVTDLMSSGLPYRERLDLFTSALLGILEAAPPNAIHWQPTQRIVDPGAYVRAAAESQVQRLFAGPVNVRFFNITGTDGDMLMDTLGLAALGLPDLQCHFRNLDPGAVARFLYNTALYVFENGDVIADGHTVEGIEPGSKWRCRHEDALVAPPREVIDLDTQDPNAAGTRNRTTA